MQIELNRLALLLCHRRRNGRKKKKVNKTETVTVTEKLIKTNQFPLSSMPLSATVFPFERAGINYDARLTFFIHKLPISKIQTYNNKHCNGILNLIMVNKYQRYNLTFVYKFSKAFKFMF